MFACAFPPGARGPCSMRVREHHVASRLGCPASKPGAVAQVVAAPDASFTAGKLDFGGLADGQAWLVRALTTGMFLQIKRNSLLQPASITKRGWTTELPVLCMLCGVLQRLLCLVAGADHLPVC